MQINEIKLCRVKNKEHEERLLEVAKWLDDNKFSCTFSIINEIAYFDIDKEEAGWDANKAVQEVISALASNLS